jgi:hypothetical protein
VSAQLAAAQPPPVSGPDRLADLVVVHQPSLAELVQGLARLDRVWLTAPWEVSNVSAISGTERPLSSRMTSMPALALRELPQVSHELPHLRPQVEIRGGGRRRAGLLLGRLGLETTAADQADGLVVPDAEQPGAQVDAPVAGVQPAEGGQHRALEGVVRVVGELRTMLEQYR